MHGSSSERHAMNVSELIKRLADWPEDSQVLVQGYETGCDAIHQLVDVKAVPNPQTGDWDGQFDLIGKVDPAQVLTSPFRAVLIVGKRRYLR
jgi:hypothetical protein